MVDTVKHQNDLLFSSDILDMCKLSAEKIGVAPDIHPNDFIFHFVINHPIFKTKKDAVDYYFTDGAKSANNLSDLLYTELSLHPEKKLKILEFASGYGCVTRHFLHKLKNVKIVSCDIHEEAVKFIKKYFFVDTVLSNSVPEKLRLNGEYDIVFALSFFSHIPKLSWGRWVKTLFSGLKENGFLIFTTHGMESAKLFGNPAIPPDGFWFLPDSEQKDLNNNEYGTTVVSPEYVVKEIYRQVRAPMALYRHAFWWNHQDLYIVQKLPFSKSLMSLMLRFCSKKLERRVRWSSKFWQPAKI